MAKGSDFERWVCKRLSRWWSNGASEDVFWRTSNSGGRASTAKRKMKNSYGDIMAIDPSGQPFIDLVTVEVKRGYSGTSIMDLLDKKADAAKQTWEKWIEQAEQASNKAATPYWWLITRRDRRREMAFMEHGLFVKLGLDQCVSSVQVNHGRTINGGQLEEILGCITAKSILDVLECSHLSGLI